MTSLRSRLTLSLSLLSIVAAALLTVGFERVIEATAPIEVQPMLEAVNRLVDQHGRRLARVRHATGNLSHALKTPLAVLGQAADAMAEQGNEALAETLRDQLDTMRAIADELVGRLGGAGFRIDKAVPGMESA